MRNLVVVSMGGHAPRQLMSKQHPSRGQRQREQQSGPVSRCDLLTVTRRATLFQGRSSRFAQDEADARTRTGDPFITSEVLYQLSYVGGVPKCSAARDAA